MDNQILQNPQIPASLFAILAGVIVLMCTVDAVRTRRCPGTYRLHFWAGIMMFVCLALSFILCRCF